MALVPDPGEFLKTWHKHNAREPVSGHDACGAWSESAFALWLTDAFPIVIDANVLRNCVGPTAQLAKRTALTSIANGRGARIFCAQHVIDELDEHLEEWANGYGVPPEVYRAAFDEAYRPLLRVVSTDGIDRMLLPRELARIDTLRTRDPDDVPTATLAIATGAMLVTMDPRPWEAVYGAEADTGTLQDWLALLMSVGDLAESEKFMTGAHATVGSITAGTIYGAYRLLRFSPELFAVAAIGVAAVAASVTRPTYEEQWEALKRGYARYEAAIARPHFDATRSLFSRLPPFPEWRALVDSTSRDAALGRACLFQLARSRTTPSRASELAWHLPDLAIGQDPMRVGSVLRRYPAFFEPYEMYWQVGRPVGL